MMKQEIRLPTITMMNLAILTGRQILLEELLFTITEIKILQTHIQTEGQMSLGTQLIMNMMSQQEIYYPKPKTALQHTQNMMFSEE